MMNMTIKRSLTQKYQSSAGFTLIEILVVVAIFGIVMSAIYTNYISSIKTQSSQEQVLELQQNLRIGLQNIEHDLRRTNFLVNNDNPDYGVAPFSVANNTTLTMRTFAAKLSVAKVGNDITIASDPDWITIDRGSDFDNPSYVRIIRPANPGAIIDDKIFTVTSDKDLKESDISTDVNGDGDQNDYVLELNDMSNGLKLRGGDMVLPYHDANTDGDNDPNTGVTLAVLRAPQAVNYSVSANGELIRDDGTTASGDVVAENVSQLQFNYYMEDGSVVAATTDYDGINAVEVILRGDVRTIEGDKARGLKTLVRIRN